MRLGSSLGFVNGSFVGSFVALVVSYLALGQVSLSVVVASAAGAASAATLTGVRPIPGTVGGLAGGPAGIGITLFPVTLLAIPVQGLSANALGGFFGGIGASRLPPLR